MRAIELAGLVFQNLNVLGQGETPSADLANDFLTRLNAWIDSLATERLTIYYTPRNTYTLTSGQQVYTIGDGGDFDQTRPLWIPFASVIPTGTGQAEIPIEVINLKDWALMAEKGGDIISGQTYENPFPIKLYYDYAWASGLGNITVVPNPTTACTLVLYTPTPLSEFADLTTEYTFPPAYRRFLETNMTIEIADPYGRPTTPNMERRAMDAKAQVKRANRRLTTVSIDPALRPRGAGGYNWKSDTWGRG
jgi:hypothetical protein